MLTLVVVLLSTRVLGFPDMSLFQGRIDTVEAIRSTMLGSIRTRYVECPLLPFSTKRALQLGTRHCCWSYLGVERPRVLHLWVLSLC